MSQPSTSQDALAKSVACPSLFDIDIYGPPLGAFLGGRHVPSQARLFVSKALPAIIAPLSSTFNHEERQPEPQPESAPKPQCAPPPTPRAWSHATLCIPMRDLPRNNLGHIAPLAAPHSPRTSCGHHSDGHTVSPSHCHSCRHLPQMRTPHGILCLPGGRRHTS